MKENWIQLIDTIEKDPFETEAFFALMEYVGEASNHDKRQSCTRSRASHQDRITIMMRTRVSASVSSVNRSGRCLIPFGVLG